MDRAMMARLLPESPPEGYEEWAEIAMCPDLDVELMLFSAERIKVYPPIPMVITPETERKPKSIWASRCTCTSCGEDFYTQHVKDGAKGFLMYQGEDGCLYSVDPEGNGEPQADEIEDFGYDNCYIQIGETDGLTCPLCFANVEAIHRSKLRGGRKKQALGCSVQNIGKYTAVIYWLTANYIYDDGSHTYETYPRDAYVITERGGIAHFRHTKSSAGGFSGERRLQSWECASEIGDESTVKAYHSWGCINNRAVGSYVYEKMPDLDGCTGEKTGIDDYIRGGGGYPVTYLKIWQKNRSVENLIRAGWVKLIEDNITRYTDYDARRIMADVHGVDFSKKKPHEMLRISKSEFKALTHARNTLSKQKFDEWVEYHLSGGACRILEFLQYFETFHAEGIGAVIAMREDDDQIDLPKVAQYLDKQGVQHWQAGLLLDARKMAEELHPDIPLTNAELWPRHLRAVHDELARLQRISKNEKQSRELDEGFARIKQMFGSLEWTDGNLRILLPQRNEDLITEGAKLNHCVGRYGEGHASGSSMIFFVRKYRRPERSYYTLNIGTATGVPKEIQLHGYGNEHHGPNNQYTHTIPKEVRAFVDRWEKEILMPFWLEWMNKEEQTA